MKKNVKKKGFTLVELIVVIAILGILAAVAVPRLSGFQDSAKEKADIANMATMKNSILAGLANEDIKLANAAVAGTITVTNPTVKGNPADFTFSGVSFPKTGDDVTKVMTRLSGADLNAQVTGKTGFVATISVNGDVTVAYKP